MVSLFLIVIFYQPVSVLAAEGDCHLEHCLVPAPTVYLPEQQAILEGGKLEVVGLTWKRTVVKVYLDGRELPVVEQYNHEDYYAGFYAKAKNLKPGRHFLYTIAHSEKPGWFDQSQESTYIYFTVKPAVAKVLDQPMPGLPPEPTTIENQPSPPDYINKEDAGSTSSSASLGVIQGQIEGGVSVEANKVNQDNLSATSDSSQIQAGEELNNQNNVATELQPAGQKNDLNEVLANEFVANQVKKTTQRNRLIGLGVLLVLIIGLVIGRWVLKNKIKPAFLKEADSQLPPAPIPPASPDARQAKPGEPQPSSSDSVIIDPIKDDFGNPPLDIIAQDEPKDYWGTGGPTPYTPSPLAGDEKKDNDVNNSNLT